MEAFLWCVALVAALIGIVALVEAARPQRKKPGGL